MTIIISEESFEPYQYLIEYQKKQSAEIKKYGAINIFIGTMRDFNEGDSVQMMHLEHYAGMTEKQLAKIINEAQKQWKIIDSLIVHRVGNIFPNETIVLIAIWSTHRGDAFDACRYIIEALKSKAPFWKKEQLINNETRWVIKNTNGYFAKDT